MDTVTTEDQAINTETSVTASDPIPFEPANQEIKEGEVPVLAEEVLELCDISKSGFALRLFKAGVSDEKHVFKYRSIDRMALTTTNQNGEEALLLEIGYGPQALGFRMPANESNFYLFTQVIDGFEATLGQA